MKKKVLVLCTTDSMIWNFLVPHIRKLQENGYTVECACSRTGDYFSWLREKCGLVMHLIPFERNPFRKANIRAYFQLKRLIRTQGYGIIFCHEPVGGAMGRLAGSKADCRIIYMAHGFHFYKGCPKSSRLYYYVERYLARKTDCLITLNQEDYEASLQFRAKHKIKTNGIGIDLSKFRPEDRASRLRQELNLDRDAFLVLSVGELIPRKNHESIIRALTGGVPDRVHYIVAGDGELRERLERLADESGLGSRVHFLGYRQDIQQLCNSCDVFALPSYQEGLSVALMEAMACGKPVIASRIRGNTDLIDHEKGGILVDAGDVSGYAKAIVILAEDEAVRRKYGEHNLEKVQEFSLERVEEQLLSVFQMIGKEDEQ